MGYLQRLGLVSRRNKEGGTISLCYSADSKETGSCTVETDRDRSCNSNASISCTTIPQTRVFNTINEERSLMAPDTCVTQDDDVEFLRYEKHVRARARADTYGDSFDWKTLIFWRRHKRPSGIRSLNASAASTPLRHQPFSTPSHLKATTQSRQKSRGYSSRCGSFAAPLYTSEFSTSNSIPNFCHHPWKDVDCNMSPYVPLGGRRPRLVTAGPLYIVD